MPGFTSAEPIELQSNSTLREPSVQTIFTTDSAIEPEFLSIVERDLTMSELHIHVDATFVPRGLDEELTAGCGLSRRDFVEAPTNEMTYTPELHYTVKPVTTIEFRKQFKGVLRTVNKFPEFVGFVEGEYIPTIHEVPERPFDPSIAIPFEVTTRWLAAGSFRESEIHVTMSHDDSDPRLREKLLKMGLLPAYYPKIWGMAQIFTVQGSRREMKRVLTPLLHFLECAGGSTRCRVKEERIARWWMSSQDLSLPPVIDSVKWR